ncbi:MAG: single-stranded-DNA-specific exonuclease RecJ, partial [Acidobacteriota bacterium]
MPTTPASTPPTPTASLPAETVLWESASVPAETDELTASGLPHWLAAVLARRGVADATAAEAFLEPSLDQLHDPRLLADLDAATERLRQARDAGERVAIVGDYDVDGVSGTALLTAVLRACGLDVLPILPHRIRDGYGFQPVHAERAAAESCAVVVTVDCGTRSLDAIEVARRAGIEVIVTDHHLPGPDRPEGVLLINPRRDDCTYPFDELAGAGLAMKLALAAAEACGRTLDPRQLVRMACLGTVADLVPLVGENRVIASIGLRELSRTRSVGLRALIEVSRVRPPLSAEDIGFRLGPRLNAPGRLDSADAALELLLTRDPERASRLAADLDARNRERRSWEQQVGDDARERFRALGTDLPAFLVAWDPTWHRGVVGIAAGRLAKEFNRPVVLLAIDGDRATGSGRSAAGLHLHDFLDRWRDQLERFGGHAQAIGLTVGLDRLDTLRDEWEAAANAEWGDIVRVRRRTYEIDLAADEIGPEVFAALRRLEPFGQANPSPMVRVRGPLRLARPPRLFGRGHLEAELVGAGRARITVLGWGWTSRAD